MKNPITLVKENPKKSTVLGAGALAGTVYAFSDSIGRIISNGASSIREAISNFGQSTGITTTVNAISDSVNGILNNLGIQEQVASIAPIASPILAMSTSNMIMKKVTKGLGLEGKKAEKFFRYGVNLAAAGTAYAYASPALLASLAVARSIPLLHRGVVNPIGNKVIKPLAKGAINYGIKAPIKTALNLPVELVKGAGRAVKEGFQT